MCISLFFLYIYIINQNLIAMLITSITEALGIFNAKFTSLGEPALNETEFKDWFDSKGVTVAQLEEWAGDLASELHSTRCEDKDAWRYEV